MSAFSPSPRAHAVPGALFFRCQMITIIAPQRATDRHGSGRYGARRGTRLHMGIDYAAWPGSLVCSATDGIVTRIGQCYAELDKALYRLIEIERQDGALIRYLYLSPHVNAGQKIKRGQVIGSAQDLRTIYEGITPHVHVDVKIGGKFVDPDIYFAMTTGLKTELLD